MNQDYDFTGINIDCQSSVGFDFNNADRLHTEGMGGIHLSYMPPDQDFIKTTCCYCSQDNPECLAQCRICANWFCNGAQDASTGSHIVKHLVRSKHKEVGLHPDSPLEGIPLECYHCGNKNVFLLGFVPAKSESMVLLLCRSPCAYQHTARDIGCDFSEWEPIISDKRFISWLIKIPTGQDLENVKPVSAIEIAQIDDTLRSANINQRSLARQNLENGGYGNNACLDDKIQKTKSVYSSPHEYQEIFTPLIQLEADYDKLMKESLHQNNVVLRCETSVQNRKTVYFQLPQSDSEMRLMQGDEVSLTQEGSTKMRLKGNVIKVPNNYGEEIGVELKPGSALPEIKTGWSVEFVWKAITFDRYFYQ